MGPGRRLLFWRDTQTRTALEKVHRGKGRLYSEIMPNFLLLVIPQTTRAENFLNVPRTYYLMIQPTECFSLSGLDTLGRFYTFPPRETTFVASCLLSCITIPFWKKRVYYKRKEFAPKGSKFFPFRVDPLLKEGKKQFWRSCLPWRCIDFPQMYMNRAHNEKESKTYHSISACLLPHGWTAEILQELSSIKV